jgi:hypothetical protein
MDTISSAEFRKTYAKLTEATIVTVNGHAIGVWNPSGAKGIAAVRDWEGPTNPLREIRKAEAEFNTRPFTPVPKTRK